MKTGQRESIRSSDLQRYVPYAVNKSSDDLGWRGMRAEIVRGHKPGEIFLPPLDHHLLNLIVATRTLHEHRWEGRAAEEIGHEGAASLVPAGCESYWRWSYLSQGEACDFHLHLKPSFVRRIAMEDASGRSATLDLRGSLCFYHPTVQQLGAALMREVEGGTRNGALYAESLATALVVVLLRLQEGSGDEGGARSMRTLPSDAIRELCDYIEEHLGSELHLQELADRAGLGPSSLVRTFRSVIGDTPHQYVLTRRMARAKEMLRSTTMPLSALALRLGFADHAHFASTFQRRTGMTPSSYRRDAS